jgi:hypothetical protein
VWRLKKRTPERLSPVFANSRPFPTEPSLTLGTAAWVSALSWTPSLECTDQDGANEGESHTRGQHIQLHGNVHRHVPPRQLRLFESIRLWVQPEVGNMLRRLKVPSALKKIFLPKDQYVDFDAVIFFRSAVSNCGQNENL